jgi:hypothetical protein
MGRSPTRLRLLPGQTTDPIPEIEHLLDPTPCRPGELHEPRSICAEAAEAIATQAALASLSFDVAGTLLLEAQLVRDALAPLGLSAAADALPREPGPMPRRLHAAEAAYLRYLLHRRGPRPQQRASAERLVLPVRLIAAAEGSTLRRASSGDIERAVDWEVCALLAGLRVREWALEQALRLSLGGR